MSTLINRVQRALLGSAGPEKVKALLADLQIPAGGSGGSIREVRRGVLRPISDEAVLRDALAAMGITGGGGNPAQGLSNIRTAVLHNVVDPETQLLAGLDDLLEPGDLAGGAGPPAWLPEGAVAYADFVNGHYYAGGSEKTLAQIIANPGKAVAGEGLYFMEGDTGVAMLGDFAAAFLTIDWTVDLTWKVPVDCLDNATVFSVHNSSGTDLVLVTVLSQGPLGVIQDWVDDWNEIGREANIGGGFGTTHDVVAGSVTRTDAKISATYSATTITNTNENFSFTPTVAEFGDAPGEFYFPNKLYIRTVAVLPST